MEPSAVNRVLIIKLGALGDFVQAMGPMAAIRRHHPSAHITLLTMPPFADLARASDLVDDVWIDTRPSILEIGSWLALRNKLRASHFEWVYDLQTSDRSGFYYRLFWPGPFPNWSGIARACSHPHDNPERDFMHTVDRQREQLNRAGIDSVPNTDLSRIQADVSGLSVKDRYALIVPGGAVHRPEKRWPAAHFAAVTAWLAERSVQPVLIGTALEADAMAEIKKTCPAALDLSDRTDFPALVSLARGAVCALGNDTGPMHLIAPGCPTVVLYSHDSDPALCGQRGPAVLMLRMNNLAAITPAAVIDAVKSRVPGLA